MELTQIIVLLITFFIVMFFVLLFIYLMLIIKNRKQIKQEDLTNNDQTNINKESSKKLKSPRGSIYDFLDFDEIKDNMIIRKNRNQYVMVVKCKGVNYDLMSEEEKVSVEAGFVQFLNTLRFPIQLYIQTTSLNLRDIVEEYKERLKTMQKDIRKINEQINLATSNGENKKVEKLSFEKRRMENVLEYSADISDYIARMSMNKNILQQKTYLIISYYASETDKKDTMFKEEIDSMCFSELYTRTQTVIRALGASGVIGKILDSEELSELLYAAYNRDESEVMQLSKALDAEYDALYSTGKDVLEKKQELMDEIIEREAVDLATNSIKIADEKIKKEKQIKEKALEIVEEYKDQMKEELYEKTKEEIKGDTDKKKRKKIKNIEN